MVNAYLLTFGGFLLLSGRLGDLLGNKRVFLGGVVSFTIASVACGLAPVRRRSWSSAARVQGLGGAAVSAVALALIMGLFTEPAERAKAMGVFGFVMSGGGAVGVLLGGVLTGLFSWHWIFLVNVPIGVAVSLAARACCPPTTVEPRPRPARRARRRPGHRRADDRGLRRRRRQRSRLDLGRTLGLLALAVLLLVAFVAWETRAAAPAGAAAAVPAAQPRRSRRSSASCGPPRCSPGSSWRALYLQQVLGYGALEVGLAFVPTSLVMAVLLAAGLRPAGDAVRHPPAAGRRPRPGRASAWRCSPGRPSTAASSTDVLPSMLLLGIGAGIAFNPVLLAAMGDVEPHEAGLASGVVNTSFMMGGALGLAVLVSRLRLPHRRRSRPTASDALEALHGGFQVAFAVGAVFALLAAVVGGALLRPRPLSAPPEEATDPAEVSCPEVA